MSNLDNLNCTLFTEGMFLYVCECLCMHDFPDIDFCVTLLLRILRLAPQVVIPLISHRIDETSDLTVTEQSFVFDLRLY